MSDHELEALLMQAGFSDLLESPSHSQVDSEESSSKRKKQKTDECLTKSQLKAKREKARREKMNRRFAALSQLSNPEDPKTDKASILLDTLVTLKSLKMENDQLKQLNKFLEVRILNIHTCLKCCLGESGKL